jgi:hypothetical protein
MIFLIEYDRRRGRRLTYRKFRDSQRQEAADARRELELDLLRRGVEHEVVVLEGPSEQWVRFTHARYFMGLREVVEYFRVCPPWEWPLAWSEGAPVGTPVAGSVERPPRLPTAGPRA